LTTSAVIVYFSLADKNLYTFNKHLTLISKACKNLSIYIDFFINIGFTFQEDLKFYFDIRRFKNIPLMTSEEFGNLAEAILLLE